MSLPRTPKKIQIDGKDELYCAMTNEKVKVSKCITCEQIFGKTLENKILCKNGSEEI